MTAVKRRDSFFTLPVAATDAIKCAGRFSSARPARAASTQFSRTPRLYCSTSTQFSRTPPAMDTAPSSSARPRLEATVVAVNQMMSLPEELLAHILLCYLLFDGGDLLCVMRYMQLREVCNTFKRILDSPDVLRRLPFWAVCECVHRRPLYTRAMLLLRLRRAGHPDAVFYEGLITMMSRRIQEPAAGMQIVSDAAAMGGKWASYFLAMMQYRANPKDPRALEALDRISGGQSPMDGRRWGNSGLPPLRGFVRNLLHSFASRLRLPRIIDYPELTPHDPHVCTWTSGCRRWPPEGTSRIALYCSPQCRIRHEFDLFTRSVRDDVGYAISRMPPPPP